MSKRDKVNGEKIVDRIRMREREVRLSVGYNDDGKATSIHLRNYWVGTGLSRSPYEHVRIPLSEVPNLIAILSRASSLAFDPQSNGITPYADED